MMEPPRLRILCLHGYRQDAESFRTKCRPIQKATKNFADFMFLTAPTPIGGKDRERGWWISRPNFLKDIHEPETQDENFEQALRLVSDIVESEGPFDGILAFSQGACFASYILRLGGRIFGDYDGVNFKFAVLFSGYESRFTRHLRDTQITIPTLHYYGLTDKVIPPEKCIDFGKMFSNIEVHEHDGGHFLPTTGDPKKIIVEYIKKFVPVVESSPNSSVSNESCG
ncbi:esterase GA18864 [Galendromus occidentalis]|uniref:Esterase GA18864 n=1 Tax=Galendromus occidentalis TaxID=34638 RepID=A0AAJ6W034_9ACAR|nr:esterase GA18864 [Galendromus occidentalis]